MIQWRFVNRIQLQMTAFKEVFWFHLASNHKVNLMKKLQYKCFLFLGIL